MEWALLRAEVEKPAYNGMNDVQVAAAINAATYQINQDIGHRQARDALLFTAAGDWGNIVGVAEGVITAGISIPERVRAISIREAFRGGMNDMFAATNDTYWTQLMVAVDAIIPEIMSAAGKANLQALRLKTLPLWQKFENRPIEWSDVQAARIWVA